jgi:hypothetical protein
MMSRRSYLGGKSDMTSRELLSLMLRRWYIVLLGATITVGALYQVTHRAGVYWSQISVVVLGPVDKYYPNNLASPDWALIPMAGVLVADWNGVDRPLLTASDKTTLFGEGERKGIQVRMPNGGSQWQPLYRSSSIDVQVVDSNPDTVAQEVRRVSAELDKMLQRRQDAIGVPQKLRMTTMVSPTNPTIQYVSGSRTRAALATGVVGAALTTIAVYLSERWLIWKRSRRGRLAESMNLEP